MKMLSAQLVPYDIRSNIIAPGRKLQIFRSCGCVFSESKSDRYIVYLSEMTAPTLGPGPHKLPKDKIPLERLGTPEDMAGTILYLTSRAGAYCNGLVTVNDGGRLCVMPSTY